MEAADPKAAAEIIVPEQFTAQAYITTDLENNQITAFHPGAMQHAHLLWQERYVGRVQGEMTHRSVSLYGSDSED